MITGQFDLVKVGPNSMVAVGCDEGGIKAWPISVERLKAPRTHGPLEGRVVDQRGDPIAGAFVERSPSRYYLDAWLEHETDLDPWKATPMTIGSPQMSYRSIREENHHPTVRTGADGRFRFDAVKLGEYVLTAEGDEFAPQVRHIKFGPEPEPQDFQLKAGRKVQNRVVDPNGQPVSGACVVLNRWHVHTDRAGYFHWSIECPLPDKVKMKVYRRYSGQYATLEATVPLSQMDSQPIILKHQ